MQPDVSVIVPIYGVEKYLRQCLDSIVNQTLKSLEIILVNDGSCDKCPQIIDEYAARDPRVKALHLTNGGYGRAINHGLDAATGRYIGIVESDDWIKEDMYQKLLENAEKTGADIVKSGFFEYFGSENGSEEHFKPIHWLSKLQCPAGVFRIYDCPEILFHHPSIWSCLYKHSFLKMIGARMEEVKGAGWVDNPWFYDTLLNGTVSFVREAFYYYRQNNPGQSSNLKDYTIPFQRWNDIWKRLKKLPRENYAKVAEWSFKKEFYDSTYAYGIAYRQGKTDRRQFINASFNRVDPRVVTASPLFNQAQKDIFTMLRNGETHRYDEILRQNLPAQG